MLSAPEQLPISSYGAIGNLRTVALVGMNGSIDWCCLPEIDSPSVFARILDSRRGGCFSIRPTRLQRSQQQYISFTNVLETIFETEGGRLIVTDFMPLDGSLHDPNGHTTAPEICRVLRAEGGDVDVDILWMPRFNYAELIDHQIEATNTGFVANHGDQKLALGGILDCEIIADETGRSVRARVSLQDGEQMALVTRWGQSHVEATTDQVLAKLDATVESWHAWTRNERQANDRSWAGYWSKHVARSELALKLLTFAPTGAIAAAATTSLPEWIGGVRNWDYRYNWIRDAGLAAQAFNAMGHVEEAGAYIEWVERVSREREVKNGSNLRIMYDVHGNVCLPERELSHLRGYRDSQPVRIGNLAIEQLQLDIFGDLLTAAYEYVRMGRDLDDEIWHFLSNVADLAAGMWDQPDEGIWEVRTGSHHFTYSKVMVWIALQRACAMARQGRLTGDVATWQAAQSRIHADVLAKAYSEDMESFTIAYGWEELDAANLLIPMREFLPFEDPRVQNTIDRTLERLTTNDLVYRYRIDDGVGGEEGTFVLCTFWLVDALALSGRLDEAYRIFDGIASRVNHVGLLSEQIDPNTGEFLGNFPQAFSHIGLINSALNLAHMEGRDTPGPPPIGSREHRIADGAG